MTLSLKIRTADVSDAGVLREIYRPYVEKTAISFELEVPAVSEFAARIKAALENWSWMVAEVDGRPVGYAYGSAHRAREAYAYSVETSAYVSETYHRGGIARSLYTELFSRLRERGFANAYAGTTLPNESSVRFHESFGFQPIGVFPRVGYKFGKWHDVAWSYCPIQRPYQVSPSLLDCELTVARNGTGFQVDQIDHVEFYVPNRNSAAKWYRDIIGLDVIPEFAHWALDPQGPLMIGTKHGGTRLALFEGDPKGSQREIGFHLVAFRVGSTSFAKFVANLFDLQLRDEHDRIVTPALVADHGKAFSVYFCDPFGHQLEITTYEYQATKIELNRIQSLVDESDKRVAPPEPS